MNEFNYPLFKQELFTITKKVFLTIQHKNLCGFVIYSDEDAGSIGIAYQTKEQLQKSIEEDPEEDPLYYKWYFAEWIGDEGENAPLFNALSKKLFAVTSKTEEEFITHKHKIFDIAVNVLLQLKNEGLFSHLNDLVLLFDIPDFEDTTLQKKWIQTLNNNFLTQEYLSIL